MKLIRTGFRNSIHRRGGMDSILRGQSAGLHFELLHRVGKRQWKIQVVFHIIVDGSIQKIQRAVSYPPATLKTTVG